MVAWIQVVSRNGSDAKRSKIGVYGILEICYDIHNHCEGRSWFRAQNTFINVHICSVSVLFMFVSVSVDELLGLLGLWQLHCKSQSSILLRAPVTGLKICTRAARRAEYRRRERGSGRVTILQSGRFRAFWRACDVGGA